MKRMFVRFAVVVALLAGNVVLSGKSDTMPYCLDCGWCYSSTLGDFPCCHEVESGASECFATSSCTEGGDPCGRDSLSPSKP